MECHRCKHRQNIDAGKYAKTPFRRTPCARCKLRECSLRTMPVDPDRPPYVPGAEGVKFHVDVPFPEEAEESRDLMPVDVMRELAARLLALPPKLRNVVCWRISGLTYPQIARKQRITTAGVEARHRRAMRMFPELRQLFILKTARATMRQGSSAGRIVAAHEREKRMLGSGRGCLISSGFRTDYAVTEPLCH